MDQQRQKEIDLAVRRARLTQLRKDFINWKVALIVGILILIVVVLLALRGEPREWSQPVFVGTTEGAAISITNGSGRTGPGPLGLHIQTKDGGFFDTTLPPGVNYRPNIPMRIAIYRSTSGELTRNTYRFDGYIDQPPLLSRPDGRPPGS